MSAGKFPIRIGTSDMMAAKSDKNGNGEVSRTIRKEIGKGANRRQLSRMPAFKPVETLPEHLRNLLARLEQSETVTSR
jgi:hypothetical protein